MQSLLELRSIAAVASNSHGNAEKHTLSRNFAPVKLPENRERFDGLAIRASANSNAPVAKALNAPVKAAPKSGKRFQCFSIKARIILLGKCS